MKRILLTATLAIFTTASVFAQGPGPEQGDEMSPFTMLVRAKFGPKDFDDGWIAAYEHDMLGAEVEIRLGTPGEGSEGAHLRPLGGGVHVRVLLQLGDPVLQPRLADLHPIH